MNYFLKTIKYALIRGNLKKSNPFNNIDFNNKAKIYIFFVACGTNMGDHAIVEAETKFISNLVGDTMDMVEILTAQTESALDKLKGKIGVHDVIVLSGGGYIGDEYIEVYKPLMRIMKIFKNNRILIFPQTIYFASKRREKKFCKLIKKCGNIDIFVRELKSKEIFNNEGISVQLVPDIVLSSKQQWYFDEERRNQILVCLRNDVERKVNETEYEIILEAAKSIGKVILTDTVESTIFQVEKRREFLDKMLDNFATSKLVITDRIHGMIFSYLTHTPCVVLGNYNHKVESEYTWLKECKYITFLSEIDRQNLLDKMGEVLSEKDSGRLDFNGCFGKLEESILRL